MINELATKELTVLNQAVAGQPGKFHIYAYTVQTDVSLRQIRDRVKSSKVERLSSTVLQITQAPWQYIYVFKFGAVVFVNIQEEYHSILLSHLGLLDDSTKLTFENEDFSEDEFVVEISADVLKVGFNSVTIPQWNPEMLLIIARSLGQSSALELVEKNVEQALNESQQLTQQLRAATWQRVNRARLLRSIGDTLQLRHQITSQLSLFDEPESVWVDENIHKLFVALFEAFDIKSRVEKIEKMLSLCADTSEIQLEILNTRRAELLEIVIIVLILFEIGGPLLNTFVK